MSVRVRKFTHLTLLLLLAAGCFFPVTAQTARNVPGLTLDDVVKLSKLGFSEEVIITRIKQNGKPFDLDTDELVALKKAGVSDNVIRYLLDPSQPYNPPAPVSRVAAPKPDAVPPAAPSVAPPSVKKYAPDPNAADVPPEPGLYHLSGAAPVKTGLKLLLGEVQGAGLGKVLMKKGRTVAYLPGAASRTRIQSPAATFYLRLGPGEAIENVVLLTLDQRTSRRELDLGPAGAKPEFRPGTVRQFDSLEVGPSLFKLTPTGLADGEYLFFVMGSADPTKGTYGKGYDFGLHAVKHK